MPPLDIHFFGSSLVSAYWNGAATYYRGIIRALAQRGHRVTFHEPDAYDRQKHRDIPDPAWAKVRVYRPSSEEAVRQEVRTAEGADIVIKASGVGVYDVLLESAMLELKSASTRVYFWDVDAPATLDRVEQDARDPFRELIPRYDCILTYGGGDPVIQAYLALGARQCMPIYNALDPETHFPGALDPRFAGDLAFLGNRLPDRERRVEEFFLNVAAMMPTQRFVLGGSGWQDKPKSPNVEYVGHVFTADHNSFNSTPRMVLNINRESMARYGFSPPTRVFEAAGVGACIITDEWRGIETFLEPGKEVLVAKDGKDVAKFVRTIGEERAREIGEAARRRILSEHTYQHRVELLETLFSLQGDGEAFTDLQLT